MELDHPFWKQRRHQLLPNLNLGFVHKSLDQFNVGVFQSIYMYLPKALLKEYTQRSSITKPCCCSTLMSYDDMNNNISISRRCVSMVDESTNSGLCSFISHTADCYGFHYSCIGMMTRIPHRRQPSSTVSSFCLSETLNSSVVFCSGNLDKLSGHWLDNLKVYVISVCQAHLCDLKAAKGG